jgi:hypothetical protein
MKDGQSDKVCKVQGLHFGILALSCEGDIEALGDDLRPHGTFDVSELELQVDDRGTVLMIARLALESLTQRDCLGEEIGWASNGLSMTSAESLLDASELSGQCNHGDAIFAVADFRSTHRVISMSSAEPELRARRCNVDNYMPVEVRQTNRSNVPQAGCLLQKNRRGLWLKCVLGWEQDDASRSMPFQSPRPSTS